MRQEYNFHLLTVEDLMERLRNASRYKKPVVDALFEEVDRRLAEWKESTRKQEETISAGVRVTGED